MLRLLVVALTLWQEPVFLAAVLGHLGHMVSDQLSNSIRPLTYSIAYRVSVRFRRERLLFNHPDPLPSVLRTNLPFSGWLEPVVLRVVARLRRNAG